MDNDEEKWFIGRVWIIATLGIFILLSIIVFYNMQPVKFEVEGSCNTGFLGIDFEGNFYNEEYRQKNDAFGDEYNFSKYNTEFLPQHFNLKNIKNLNCNYKIKGNLPKYIIEGDYNDFS